MGEEGIIEKYLQPLTNGNKFALGLRDDIAKIDQNTIIKTDTTIEGVHILQGLPANFIAYKAMARCFSDVFAKGGRAIGYLTNIILPKNFQDFDELFAGFSQFAKEHNVDLLGGDLSTHNASNIIIIVSVVAKASKDVLRFNAKIGDGLYLTKEIGAAYLGFLDVKNGNLQNGNWQNGNWQKAFAGEYLMPSLVLLDDFENINASMDISDGLIQDAKKMAKASNVCFEIDYNLLPFAKNVGANNNSQENDMLSDMLSFGDDYNILISSKVPVQNARQIGVVKQGRGLNLLNFPFEIFNAGYDHFA